MALLTDRRIPNGRAGERKSEPPALLARSLWDMRGPRFPPRAARSSAVGALILALTLLNAGCAQPAVAPRTPGANTKAAGLAEGAPRAPLAWADLDAKTLARAKAERKYVVLDGSAEWCHWCHVMEASTYHDEAVRKLLDAHFIAVKVDVDARPDIEERYGDYGWPATVIFSPDATELGKYRGYIAPEKFVTILEGVVASKIAEGGASTGARAGATAEKPAAQPLSEDALGWIARMVDVELEEYWDDARGGWGRTQKAPLAWDNAWALRRAKGGDANATEWRRRALYTLEQQSKLVDPVWGGIYQYSAAADWDHPHFEKLMTFQAGALDNYAEAYALTRDPKHLLLARKMREYLEGFLLSPAGGFYATQDADVNAHEPGKRFMSGHEFYAMGDAGRRAAGIPRVDAHEYGKENGLAIAAYCTYYEATHDASALAVAERAAARILATHAARGEDGRGGGITHDAQKPGAPAKVLYLADEAAFGLALARLYEVTGKREHLEAARGVATAMLRDLEDPRGGGFFASTPDPDAAGVFAVRRTPFEDNVTALRLLARLARADAAAAPVYRRAIARTLSAIATPGEIKGRGRMLGDFLLALEETTGVR